MTPARDPAMLQAYADAYHANGGVKSTAAVAIGMAAPSGQKIYDACVEAGLIEAGSRWKLQRALADKITPGMEVARLTTARDADDNVTGTYLVEKPDRGEAVVAPLPGFAVARRTVHRMGGEVIQEWTQEKPGAALSHAAMREFAAALIEPIVGMAPLSTPPEHTDDDLLVVYPMGDPHFGLYAWAEEAGENFDLAEAERVTCAAIDRLVALAPAATYATLLNLGDYFHSNDGGNQTAKGTPVDIDGRSQKVLRVGVKALRWCVLRLLEKHKFVRVRNVKGNHDSDSHFVLSLALEGYFENDPRVTIDMSPAAHSFQRFGKVLIGECHGDTTRLVDLPGVMMNDAREHISETEFWVWHVGHVHHDSVKEYQNVLVETHRTLAAKDAWHAGKGYRSGRTMKAIAYHREFGEQYRSTCGIAMLRAA